METKERNAITQQDLSSPFFGVCCDPTGSGQGPGTTRSSQAAHSRAQQAAAAKTKLAGERSLVSYRFLSCSPSLPLSLPQLSPALPDQNHDACYIWPRGCQC